MSKSFYDQPVFVGQVLYDVRGILEKNRDTFRDDILNMLKDSRQDIWIIQFNPAI